MYQIEIVHSQDFPSKRIPSADFCVFFDYAPKDVQQPKEGHPNVYTLYPYEWGPLSNPNSPMLDLNMPVDANDMVRDFSSICSGQILMGNAGPELTYRHMLDSYDNITKMIEWAEWAYSLVGDKLVLVPIDFDIVIDAILHGKFMTWCAQHKVSLLVLCGYRFLFPNDAFPMISGVSKNYPFEDYGWRFPETFNYVSEVVKGTGVDMWTGAGHFEGLTHGVVEKAGAFGFTGVATYGPIWTKWLDTKKGGS